MSMYSKEKKELYNLLCRKPIKKYRIYIKKKAYTTVQSGPAYLHLEHKLILEWNFSNVKSLKCDDTLFLKPYLPFHLLNRCLELSPVVSTKIPGFLRKLLMTAICVNILNCSISIKCISNFSDCKPHWKIYLKLFRKLFLHNSI